MEELTQRAVLRNLQKEQERERRRLRDRQRRQAMSVEEREKHLARRRRNYQLRRQRARNVRDPQVNQSSLADSDEMLTLSSNENHQAEIISVPVQSNGISRVDLDQRQGSLDAGNANSVGLEVPAHKLAKLPIRSRLNHIKNLARSLVDTLEIGDSHKITADLITKGDATSNCTPPKALRLNRVKHLARVLSSDATTTTTIENRNCETEVVQNPPSGEHLMSNNLPKFVLTSNASGGDE